MLKRFCSWIDTPWLWLKPALAHLCLHHVVALLPHPADETADVDNPLFLDLVEAVVDGQYRT